jgi:hypothetical protein
MIDGGDIAEALGQPVDLDHRHDDSDLEEICSMCMPSSCWTDGALSSTQQRLLCCVDGRSRAVAPTPNVQVR